MSKDPGAYEFVPLTRAQLAAYAKELQRADRNLSWGKALERARQHEAERVQAYAQVDQGLARKRGNRQ